MLPSVGLKCNLAKAILVYEEGDPSFCLDNGGRKTTLCLDGLVSKRHRQATFHGFVKHPSSPEWLWTRERGREGREASEDETSGRL